jgi:hypothetical protein
MFHRSHSEKTLTLGASTKLVEDIVVIGGGLVGLSVAAGLAHRGFQVRVIEKYNFMPVGAALGIAPNGFKALKEIVPGLDVAVAAVGVLGATLLLILYHTMLNIISPMCTCSEYSASFH